MTTNEMIGVHTCVASEYGVREPWMTNCDPNRGKDSVLSDDSSRLIVSCLGTIVNNI